MTSPEERRKKRSHDPLVALHYQLSIARAEGDLETIVLADHAGTVVAGAGSWSACEEIAAYAPLFSQDDEDGAGSRISELRSEVEVRALRISGQDVLLCSRRTRSAAPPREDAVSRAAEGISRILRAA
ncbi:MAG: hypothetical protein ABI461_10220 [Polyangiaceae bacterium]